ncbi:hypothetical protein QQS21_001840 [Conoideocrella luteorostrata]|uniref:ubiquitinyl hydrolase 1 n=1 Tax=Conoideocrella luteorostrata TaxID=1105319 RepID=A0AAJ0CZ24_9HYPO|nr:hypothetical protein QQS21_001840 [Conoideocrella luteorostrata]
MNAPEIDLGEQLTDFKEATKEIDTSLRGHRISSNSFIRTIHNSFTRRMDHLNADLCLRNDFDDANSNAKKKNSSRKFPARGSGRKRPAYEYGYHFIAYVFSNGYVWELDGLRTNPYKLGPSDEKDWTAVARPQIEARMLQYEGSQLSFNLLAVCRSTLPHLSQTITIMLAAIRLIQTRMKGDTVFNDIVCADEQLLDVHNQTQLAEFHIHLSEVESAEVPMELKSALSRLHWPVEEAYEMYQRFRAKLKAAMDEFRFELMFTEEDERRVRGRKRDYGGALHCWVKKLAEKGVLADIIRMSS